MMTSFGDYEPEDAWDVEDDAVDMARNLLRRLDALDDSSSRRPIEDVIGDIEIRIGRYRLVREQLSDRERLRLDQLIEDLPVLQERAAHG
jgi:hypothetical protein